METSISLRPVLNEREARYGAFSSYPVALTLWHARCDRNDAGAVIFTLTRPSSHDIINTIKYQYYLLSNEAAVWSSTARGLTNLSGSSERSCRSAGSGSGS